MNSNGCTSIEELIQCFENIIIWLEQLKAYTKNSKG